ncbi:MAG: hypothetical protein CBC55_05040 [Gammaproteobacteria bacterium TMED95]|nr:MAG: hypothetical protein CBC55_05040 [Gammaproteobacteria bacterium TMED95]|tara:strand:- start:9375 stop:10433 length:1059 start_codon:yes stop_codon:yes gene_type:complete
MLAAIIDKNFDEYCPDNYAFVKALQECPRMPFEDAVGIFPELREVLSERFWDSPDEEDEDTAIENAINERDITFAITSKGGHTVGAYYEYGGFPTYFTDEGVSFSKLEKEKVSPMSFIKKALKAPHELSQSQSLYVTHGTSVDDASSIMKDGVDMDKCMKGHAGKAFYTSPDFTYANTYGSSIGGETLLFKVSPVARIIKDTDREFENIQDRMGYDDFPELCRSKGIDGILIPSMNLIAFYNPAALDRIGSIESQALQLTSHVYNVALQAGENLYNSQGVSNSQILNFIIDKVAKETGVTLDANTLSGPKLPFDALLERICIQTFELESNHTHQVQYQTPEPAPSAFRAPKI